MPHVIQLIESDEHDWIIDALLAEFLCLRQDGDTQAWLTNAALYQAPFDNAR